MKSAIRMIVTAAAGFCCALIAIALIEGPSPLQLDLDGMQGSSTVRPEQRNGSAGAEHVAEQLDSRDVIVDERVEQVDVLADTQRGRESAQEETTAGAASLEQNRMADSGSSEFRRENYEQGFASESRDPEWSSGMEAQILSEISQMSGLSANLIEVDCRATRCRVEFILTATPTPPQTEPVASTDGVTGFDQVAEHVGLETEHVFVSASEPGQVVFLTYLSRPEDSTTQSVFQENSSA